MPNLKFSQHQLFLLPRRFRYVHVYVQRIQYSSAIYFIFNHPSIHPLIHSFHRIYHKMLQIHLLPTIIIFIAKKKIKRIQSTLSIRHFAFHFMSFVHMCLSISMRHYIMFLGGSEFLAHFTKYALKTDYSILAQKILCLFILPYAFTALSFL